MKNYKSSDWTSVMIPRETHARIKRLADDSGMKIWCVVDKHIPSIDII